MTKLDTRLHTQRILETDDAAEADFGFLLDTLTDVIRAGEGSTEILASLKPTLVALTRCGISAEDAVNYAAVLADLRLIDERAARSLDDAAIIEDERFVTEAGR
jgi:hypothetical protein